MDVLTVLVGLGGGLGGLGLGYLLARLLRREEIKEYDYDVLVLYDIASGPVVLTKARVAEDGIRGVPIPAPRDRERGGEAVEVRFSWADDKHPADYIHEREGHDGAKAGIILCRIKDGAVAPVLDVDKFVQFIRDNKLIQELTDTVVKLQSLKLDAYNKFFEEYKMLRDALFGDDIVKHVRAIGALCAKMPNLLDHFSTGYVVAKLSLEGEPEIQKEELKQLLENPTSVIRSFAELVADAFIRKLEERKKEKE